MKSRVTTKMSSKPEERRRLAAKSEDDAEIRTVIITLKHTETSLFISGATGNSDTKCA